ncbi:MAG: thiamine pyrophosphate-binding protein, partial [Burkholderiales bacterium]|nr:thiamine pyrophosphate-binding protein [Burkholderiales bacterium]
MDPTGTASHGGDRVAAALVANGVRVIFTLCGGHISPILVAAKARGIRVVDTRDEATAVFAADAVARLTGAPGVAAVTAGPGLTNTITALKNAQLAQSPVLLLGGAAPTALQGRGALQDIDQRPLIAPHVKWLRQVRRVAQLGPAVEQALATARDGVPGPTYVECAVDLLYDEAVVRGWYADAAGKGRSWADRALRWYLNRHAQHLFAGSRPAYVPAARNVAVPDPSERSVAQAAAALATAQRPLIVIGSQAMVDATHAGRLADAVERLGVPVYLSGMARGLLGREARLQMRHARRQALRESDCVLLAGVPCDFRLDYGRHVRRSATLIAANRSRHDARLNRKPSIEAIGDAGRFITSLAARVIERARRPEWLTTLARRDAEREAEIDAQARIAGTHVNPVGFLRALEEAAADDA